MTLATMTLPEQREVRLGIIAREILPIICKIPDTAHPAEIHRTLKQRKGEDYANLLDVCHALDRLGEDKLVTAKEVRHPRNGHQVKVYHPTWRAGFRLAEERAASPSLLDAFTSFAFTKPRDSNGGWWSPQAVKGLATLLRKSGISTVHDLTSKKKNEVYRVPGTGYERVKFLTAFMSYHGLKFAE